MKAPLFEVADIPGKGKGLIALADIPQGTRISCEKPMLLAPCLGPDALEISLAAQLKKLSRAEQRQFLSFRNNFPGKYPFGGIIRTNALPCGSGSTVDAGMYPIACRINHSCLPNSQHKWNPELKHETVHAIRPISRGDEITINYGYATPSAPRRAYLQEELGFTCECALCMVPPAWLARDDHLREAIEVLDQQTGALSGMFSSPLYTLRQCHMLLQILHVVHEGCPGIYKAKAFDTASAICLGHGDQARGSILAQLSYDAGVICQGDDTLAVKKVKATADNPAEYEGLEVFSSD
ncbi:SET domain-containing protein [Sarocladium implicatum]|nr:SET domain-containing protein [Sarocladium implicatum]